MRNIANGEKKKKMMEIWPRKLLPVDHLNCNTCCAKAHANTQGTKQYPFFRLFYGRCPEGIGRHNVKMSVYLSICPFVMSYFFPPLIGQKRECYIVKEVIEVDEHEEGNLKSAAAGKQHK